MKNTLILLGLMLLLSASAGYHELKNPYIKLKINDTGGRIETLRFLPGEVDLTMNDGLLGDNFWDIPASHFFLTKLYYTPITGKGFVTLTGHHTGGGIDYMQIKKTVRLPEDEARILVNYKLTNLQAAMSELEYGYWMQNFAGIPGRECTYFFPTLKGIMSVSGGSQQGELWFNQPSRGWVGFSDSAGNGMAMTMDFTRLKTFYGWYAKGETTQEWRFEKIRIPHGKSLDTQVEFIPFTGLKKISGAGGGLVGELTVIPEKAAFQTNQWLKRDLRLRVYSAKKQSITVKLTARLVPNGAVHEVGSREMRFEKPGDIKNIQISYRFPVPASAYDVEARAFASDGRLLAIFNVPAEISSVLDYNMQPEQELRKDDGPTIDLTRLDTSLETPHIKWAKPLRNGKIRVLALTAFPSWRELAELTQRLDIELTSMVWTLPHKPIFSYGPYYGVLTNQDVLNNLDGLLARDYDVILLAGINWDHLTKAQRSEIVRKVKGGCGFVEIGNSCKTGELKEISAFGKAITVGTTSVKRVREGFLSSAIPFELFPATINREVAANGTVFAVSGKNSPWVVARQVGKGYSVGLGWYSGGGAGRFVNGMTPELPYPLKNAPFKDYFELYFLMTAKALVAAAHRVPEIFFDKIESSADQRGISFRIALAGSSVPDSKLHLTAFVRNRDNQELARKTFSLKSGKEFRGTIPVSPWGGRQLLGLILADSDGNVIDFGAASVKNPPEAEILSVKPENDVCRENQTAVFTVNVSRPLGTLVWALIDVYGRVVSSGSLPAGKDNRIETLIANNLKMRSYIFRVELLSSGRVIDRAEASITAIPSPEKLVWDDYEPGIWVTPRSGDAIRPFLHPLFAEKLRELRMQTILGNRRETEQTLAIQHNFNPTKLQHAGINAARLPAEYQKTGNKMLLVRKPCLTDREFCKKTVQQFRKLGGDTAAWGPRFYWFGDELSLAGYWSTPIDFCFSPTCLEHFRDFLVRKYGSLQEINRQWGTKYKNLQEVLPETAAEARKHRDGNYSAWADHLEYMDGLLVEHISRVTKGLRQGDPDAKTFISGPQAASAYGGNDWCRQTPIYSGVMSYNGGGFLDLMRSFAPDGVILPWMGYNSSDGMICYQLWHSLMFRARGAMFFHAASMINPDYTLSPTGKATAKYMPEIVEGTAKLVLNALKEYPRPEILIVYSQASIRAAFIKGRAADHEKLRWKYITLCRNFGIPFRFVSDGQIAEGILNKLSAKLVIFPDIAALSDSMLDEISRYTVRGGKILVDGQFATMDSSCRMQPKRGKWKGRSVLRPDECRTDYISAWGKPALQRSRNERNILEQDRKMFAAVLKQAAVTPLCRIMTSAGKPYLDAEIDIMRDRQGNDYVLIISREDAVSDVRLEFRSSRTVCDIRGSGAKLGNSSPIFVALLPEKEKAPVRITAGGAKRDFQLRLDAAAQRDTVIRLTVIRPDGRELPWYAANLNAPLGKAVHRIKFAQNDPAGIWKIRAREIVTGRTAELELRVN